MEGRMKLLNTNFKNFNNDNNSVVGVVVAVLLVGLFVAIVIILQTSFVPNWMKQMEAEHLDNVGDKFAMLKFSVDLQSTSEKDIPITTSIPLGNKELPFLSSSHSSGLWAGYCQHCLTGPGSWHLALAILKMVVQRTGRCPWRQSRAVRVGQILSLFRICMVVGD